MNGERQPWTEAMGLQIGNVSVATSVNGGLPPEYYAQRIVDRLIVIGDQAPEPLRQQAHAYRGKMLAIVLAGLKQAIEGDRRYRR